MSKKSSKKAKKKADKKAVKRELRKERGRLVLVIHLHLLDQDHPTKSKVQSKKNPEKKKGKK